MGYAAGMDVPTKMTAERHTVPVSRPPRKSRNVRVEDELWDAAQRAADEQRHVLSEQIRYMLQGYVAANDKRKKREGKR
jgi:hypothetical protein